MLQRVSNIRKPLRVWPRQLSLQFVVRNVFEPQRLDRLQRTQTFEEGFLEGAADGHDFAHGFHLGAEDVFGFAKLFKVPLRNFRHHVIDRRFERGRSLLRDVVRNFVEPVTDGELGGDFRDGKAGRL